MLIALLFGVPSHALAKSRRTNRTLIAVFIKLSLLLRSYGLCGGTPTRPELAAEYHGLIGASTCAELTTTLTSKGMHSGEQHSFRRTTQRIVAPGTRTHSRIARSGQTVGCESSTRVNKR